MRLDALKHYGVVNGLLYLVNRAFDRITAGNISIYRYFFVSLPTDTRIPMPRRLGREFITRFPDKEEVIVLDVPRPRKVLEDRLRGGSECLVCFRENEFVGYIWLQDEAYLEDEVRCRYILPSGKAIVWDYDLFIDPQFRNSAAFLKIWSDALLALRSRGANWTVSRISVFAPESLNAHLRMGATRIGNAVFLRFFSFQIMLASFTPHLHVSFGQHRIPNLKIVLPDG